jgi:hypothetical protein
MRHSHLAACLCAAVLALTSLGCGDQIGFGDEADETIFLDLDGHQIEIEPLTSEEHHYLEAGGRFAMAMATGRYEDAYDFLSSHAKQRMSRNQFEHPDDDAAAEANERNPLRDVSRETFVQAARWALRDHGPPKSISNYYVESVDPEVLSGRGHPLEVVFAIGAMPDSVPTDIRRASLRATIRMGYNPGQLEEWAADLEMKPEELMDDEEYFPHYTLKYVLVEEDNELKVGYFVLLPPSLFD